MTPIHQWTHGSERVLLLKCVSADRRSHGGFVWPEHGPVMPTRWSREPSCDSGGLFGWPWGLGRGGKEPEYRGDALWIVFAAHPEDVILVGGDKAKAVPSPEQGRVPEVLFCGSYVDALAVILPGQLAWIEHAARGAASATGASGAASATGASGAASATGWRGAASATGASGAASATGWRGAASATGWRGAASATGASGAASATGERGAASATGERGAASATGARGAASATGWRGIAAVTGPAGIIEAGPGGIAVTTAEAVTWIVHEDALFLQRWPAGHVLLTAQDIGAKTGDRVRIVRGKREEAL